VNLQFSVTFATAAIGQPFQHCSWALSMQSYRIPKGDKTPATE